MTENVQWPVASTRARIGAIVAGMDPREADEVLAASLPMIRGERRIGWDEGPMRSVALAAATGGFHVPSEQQRLWRSGCEAMVDVVREETRERRDMTDAFLLHVANLVVVGGRASLQGLPERTRDDFVATVRDHAIGHPDRTTGLLEAAGLLGCLMLTAPTMPGWDLGTRRDARFDFDRAAVATAGALVEALGPRALGDAATKAWIMDLGSRHLLQ